MKVKRGDFLKRAAQAVAGTVAAAALPPAPASPEPVEKPSAPVVETVTLTPPALLCPHCGGSCIVQVGQQHDPTETRKIAWGQHSRFQRSLCPSCGWERVQTKRW